MSTTEVRRPEPAGPGWRKWLLPAILALLIAAIVLGAFFATHPHVFGGGATNTPTPTSTPRPTATPHFPPTATPQKGHVITATPKPGPTGTPRPGPTGTPRPTPTTPVTPTPNVTPTPTLRIGYVSYPQPKLNAIRQGVSSNDPSYAYYQDPFKVVQNDLTIFGFNGATIVSPQPGPTPTPYTGNSGLPEVQITVQYQGKRYLIVLDQKSLGGAKAWLIVRIKPL